MGVFNFVRQLFFQLLMENSINLTRFLLERIKTLFCIFRMSQFIFNVSFKVRAAGTLLMIEYNTLSEYLFLLRGVAESLAPHGPSIMLYLAAAVSDFYVPSQNMVSLKRYSASYLLLNSVIQRLQYTTATMAVGMSKKAIVLTSKRTTSHMLNTFLYTCLLFLQTTM